MIIYSQKLFSNWVSANWVCLLLFCLIFYLPAVAMESAGFMNALTSAATAAPIVRKRKRVTTAAKVFFCFWYALNN